MSARNPYRTARKVLTVVGKVLVWTYAVGAVVILEVGMFALYGGWGLLVLPGILAGIGLLSIIAIATTTGISRAWRSAEAHWERKRRDPYWY